MKLEMDLQLFGQPLNSKGTTLSYKLLEEFKALARVKSIPAVGSDPEKLDITDLSSAAKGYIPGLQDTDNFEFAFIDDNDNFNELFELVEANKSVDWKVEYPSGRAVTFSGIPSLKIDGTEVNQVVGFSLVVVVDKAPVIVPKTVTP